MHAETKWTQRRQRHKCLISIGYSKRWKMIWKWLHYAEYIFSMSWRISFVLSSLSLIQLIDSKRKQTNFNIFFNYRNSLSDHWQFLTCCEYVRKSFFENNNISRERPHKGCHLAEILRKIGKLGNILKMPYNLYVEFKILGFYFFDFAH